MEECYVAQYGKKYFRLYSDTIKYIRDKFMSQNAEDNFIKSEQQCRKNILTMPYAYKLVDFDNNPNRNIRYANFNNYTIFYSVNKNIVEFWSIYYSKRNFQKLNLI